MVHNSQIRIGPEFFAKIKNDYSNWSWALVREFAQNSIDAKGSKNIEFTISLLPNGCTQLICHNDGAPMTRDILTNKLLTLGGSGKNFEDGNIGGFGVAKSLLYYCHRHYTIYTGDYKVVGSGAQYTIEDAEYFAGTKSIIEMDGDHVDSLCRQVRLFAAYSQWSGRLALNGKELECNHPKGAFRRSFEWGSIYTNKQDSNRYVVRLGGIPMFIGYCSLDRLVVVELSGKSDEVLQSNRDGLKSGPHYEFMQFLQQLAVDKNSALRQRVSQITVYQGDLLGVKESRDDVISGIVDDVIDSLAPVSEMEVDEIAEAEAEGGVPMAALCADPGLRQALPSGIRVTVERRERLRSMIGHEFVIMNNLGMEIPDYYKPGRFSSYSAKLVRYWTRIFLMIWELRGHNSPFSVGFVFDDDCAAMHSYEERDIFYINPATVVRQRNSNSRSLKCRCNFTPQGKWQLVADAIHEYAHYCGFKSHDEDYAAKLTDLMGWALANRDKFNKCFR